MAKGWESKAVENQLNDFEEKEDGKSKRQLTSDQVEVHRRREVLLLSRTRVQNDLQASQNPRYQEQLRQALAQIDAQLLAIGKN